MRVGVARLLRNFIAAIVAFFQWLCGELDYAKKYRSSVQQ